jgi:hypothetical protein
MVLTVGAEDLTVGPLVERDAGVTMGLQGEPTAGTLNGRCLNLNMTAGAGGHRHPPK